MILHDDSTLQLWDTKILTLSQNFMYYVKNDKIQSKKFDILGQNYEILTQNPDSKSKLDVLCHSYVSLRPYPDLLSQNYENPSVNYEMLSDNEIQNQIYTNLTSQVKIMIH